MHSKNYNLLKNAIFNIFVVMKKLIKKLVLIPSILFVLVFAILLIADNYILPNLVDAPEVVLPNLVGLNKEEAKAQLEQIKLIPVEEGPRYDARFDVDEVIFQNPNAGTRVKEGRRIYIHISGGEAKIKMPSLFKKTLRDAKITLERRGLFLGEIEEMRSELPKRCVVDQEFPEGELLVKGDSVNIKISLGPKLGMIRVPSLIGKTLNEASRILRRNSLNIGEITYSESPSLLPNRVFDQFPSEEKLISVGDSVDVFVTKSITENN